MFVDYLIKIVVKISVKPDFLLVNIVKMIKSKKFNVKNFVEMFVKKTKESIVAVY